MDKVDTYNNEAARKYYEVVGEDVDSEINEAEKRFTGLIPRDLPGKNVLDLGCGNGRHSELFCQSGANKVIALDCSESMLHRAMARKKEKKLNNLEMISADMNYLPLNRIKFDLVFSRFSLMYTAELEKVMSCLGQFLVKGGKILIETTVVYYKKDNCRNDLSGKTIPLILRKGDKKMEFRNYPYTLNDYLGAFEISRLNVTVAEIFPADNLSISANFPYRDIITYNYGIFKAIH